MSNFAIASRRFTANRAFMAMLLVAIGLIAGFGLAHLGAIVGGPAAAAAVTTSSVSADEAYRAQVASERALVAPQVTAEQSYLAHQAGERAVGGP
jgi:enoyl-CoA hydratase/carnithine racemase